MTATATNPTLSARIATSSPASALRMAVAGTIPVALALGLVTSAPVAFLALLVLTLTTVAAIKSGRHFNLGDEFLLVESVLVPIAAIATLAIYFF